MIDQILDKVIIVYRDYIFFLLGIGIFKFVVMVEEGEDFIIWEVEV